MKLEELIITECPAAFLDVARKHNLLVQLIAGMAGSGSVTVEVSTGRILITGTGTGGTDTALTARVAALESTSSSLSTSVTTLNTLTSGLSRTSVSYCTGGSTSTKTVLMS